MKQRVPDEAAGERLDRYLASLPEIGSRGTAERLLETGVLVDGRERAKSHRLSGGEEVEFDAPDVVAPTLAALLGVSPPEAAKEPTLFDIRRR